MRLLYRVSAKRTFIEEKRHRMLRLGQHRLLMHPGRASFLLGVSAASVIWATMKSGWSGFLIGSAVALVFGWLTVSDWIIDIRDAKPWTLEYLDPK